MPSNIDIDNDQLLADDVGWPAAIAEPVSRSEPEQFAQRVSAATWGMPRKISIPCDTVLGCGFS